MPPVTRELVLKKLRDCFPESQGAKALAVLDSYGGETWHRERERVQLAMLMQSEGSLDRLRQLLALANVDYRDVLAGAGYPEETRSPLETSARELSAIRKRDRERYESWLRSGRT